MLEFFANISVSEVRLVRFIESRLNCGIMQRQIGADEMLWSRGMFSLLDLDPESDKPALSLLLSMQHPDDRPSMEKVNANMAAAKPWSRRYRVIRRDGTMRMLSQYVEFLFDASGKAERAIGLVWDVTDIADLEEKEQSLRHRLEAIARDSGLVLNLLRPDGYVTDIVGNGQASEIELNRRYGFLWRDLIHADDRVDTLKEFQHAIEAKAAVTREHRILQADSTYRWRRSIWSPVFDSSQNLKEFVSISIDIEKEKTVPTSKDVGGLVTGAQIRAGRALVRWSVQNLSDASSVTPAVVRRIEEFDGITSNTDVHLHAIRHCLETAGVEFVFPPTGKPGVRPA